MIWRRSALRLLAYRFALVALGLGLWQLASDRWVSSYWIASPAAIWTYFLGIARSGILVEDMQVTLLETLYGYLTGAAVGIVVGFLLARSRMLADLLNPFFLAFYGVPRTALAPLFILWFGIGLTSKVVLAASIVFPLTLFQTFYGVRSVDAELKNLVRIMGASERQVLQKIVLPAASPWIIAGLKISVPQALVGAIVGEFIASGKGLGYRIQLDANLFNTTGTMTGILILAVIVVFINEGLDRVERHVMRWQPREQAEHEPEGQRA